MRKLLLSLIMVAALMGCASNEYAQYTTTQQVIANSRAQADTARYQALASIAKDGTDSAKVAAVMALALGGDTQGAQQVATPQPNQALQWASILVPSVMQAYAIGKNAEVAINSSNNAAATSAATTAGFIGIASKIQAPSANVSTVTTDNHASSTTSTTSSTSSTDTSLAGTGVLGSGTYSTQANPITTTTTTTSTPTVVPNVIQITPVVVPDTIQVVPIANPNAAPVL